MTGILNPRVRLFQILYTVFCITTIHTPCLPPTDLPPPSYPPQSSPFLGGKKVRFPGADDDDIKEVSPVLPDHVSHAGIAAIEKQTESVGINRNGGKLLIT